MPCMCVGGIWRVNWIGGLSNHAPRMVSGIRGGEGVAGKPLMTVSWDWCPLVEQSVQVPLGLELEMVLGHWQECCVRWIPRLWRRVSKALLIGVCSTRCWRGGLIEGVTGGVAGGSGAVYGADGGGALA